MAAINGCDQCEAAMIDGVFCHETGCPNQKKRWDPEREQWIRWLECPECGGEVEEGESCDCREPLEYEGCCGDCETPLAPDGSCPCCEMEVEEDEEDEVDAD